jgi:hypothetical protein
MSPIKSKEIDISLLRADDEVKRKIGERETKLKPIITAVSDTESRLDGFKQAVIETSEGNPGSRAWGMLILGVKFPNQEPLFTWAPILDDNSGTYALGDKGEHYSVENPRHNHKDINLTTTGIQPDSEDSEGLFGSSHCLPSAITLRRIFYVSNVSKEIASLLSPDDVVLKTKWYPVDDSTGNNEIALFCGGIISFDRLGKTLSGLETNIKKTVETIDDEGPEKSFAESFEDVLALKSLLDKLSLPGEEKAEEVE